MRNTTLIIVASFLAGQMGLLGCSDDSTAPTIGDMDDPIDSNGTYVIVDTDQALCYDTTSPIGAPATGEAFSGQDAQHQGMATSYTDNGDGTVTDNVTGLMWQQDPGAKLAPADAIAGADDFELAGHTDWRLPSIKELYSLIRFNGTDPDPEAADLGGLTPFIDTSVFAFSYGDVDSGERIIDVQYMSSTQYVSTTMNGDATVFGVNFADGRIKGYPMESPDPMHETAYYVIHVRGNPEYGINSLMDNGDGTVTDAATGLMWMQQDSGEGLNWENALAFAEDCDVAEYDDWRLPNAKELQSLVDYTRSPATTNSPALDPVFECSAITDEGGGVDYPFFWTSTTHASASGQGSAACYLAFGTALGFLQPPGGGAGSLMDVHGAGAQRSDPKVGDPAAFPEGRGPQGDVVRIFNHVRCVRGTSGE